MTDQGAYYQGPYRPEDRTRVAGRSRHRRVTTLIFAIKAQAVPESIRARATEVPVFFSRARNGKGGTCLGVFEGYSLMEGPPAQPDEMPRITLFIDTLAQAANQRRTVFLREVRTTYLHELGHYFGWDEGQIANVGLA
jgi:predicted Zn-dependent protease with MMP-like domain